MVVFEVPDGVDFVPSDSDIFDPAVSELVTSDLEDSRDPVVSDLVSPDFVPEDSDVFNPVVSPLVTSDLEDSLDPVVSDLVSPDFVPEDSDVFDPVLDPVVTSSLEDSLEDSPSFTAFRSTAFMSVTNCTSKSINSGSRTPTPC